MMALIQLLSSLGFVIGLSAAVYLREVKNRPVKDWGEFVLASVAFALLTGEYVAPPETLAIPDDTLLGLAVALLVVAEIVAFYAALDD